MLGLDFWQLCQRCCAGVTEMWAKADRGRNLWVETGERASAEPEPEDGIGQVVVIVGHTAAAQAPSSATLHPRTKSEVGINALSAHPVWTYC
jgi:hypothetical protein